MFPEDICEGSSIRSGRTVRGPFGILMSPTQVGPNEALGKSDIGLAFMTTHSRKSLNRPLMAPSRKWNAIFR